MFKKISKEEKKEQQNPERKNNTEANIYYCVAFFEIDTPNIFENKTSIYPPFVSPKTKDRTLDVFRPPSA